MRKGKLVIFGGPMFAGKTTALYEWSKKLSRESYVLVKPSVDTRDGDGVIATHNGIKMKVMAIKTLRPELPTKVLKEVRTVLMDELNFFSYEKIGQTIDGWLTKGVDVVGAGLLYDFLKQPFGATLPLSKDADKFVELYAKCDGCGGEANHSYRKVKRKSQVLVGAEESYGACCAKCWEKLSAGSSKLFELEEESELQVAN